MESPLQVTIMLALIEGGGEPPEQRWKLFHDYYDVIYRREKERGTPFSGILGKYEPDIHWLHHRGGMDSPAAERRCRSNGCETDPH